LGRWSDRFETVCRSDIGTDQYRRDHRNSLACNAAEILVVQPKSRFRLYGLILVFSLF
jgi:hypothetical protein